MHWHRLHRSGSAPGFNDSIQLFMKVSKSSPQRGKMLTVGPKSEHLSRSYTKSLRISPHLRMSPLKLLPSNKPPCGMKTICFRQVCSFYTCKSNGDDDLLKDGKFGNFYTILSHPHKTPGPESLSKWVPTHPKQRDHSGIFEGRYILVHFLYSKQFLLCMPIHRPVFPEYLFNHFSCHSLLLSLNNAVVMMHIA